MKATLFYPCKNALVVLLIKSKSVGRPTYSSIIKCNILSFYENCNEVEKTHSQLLQRSHTYTKAI